MSAAAERDDSAPALRPRQLPARLRVGLLAGEARQPRWLLDAFSGRAFAAQGDLVLIALGNGPTEAPLPRAWRTYLRLDELCGRLVRRRPAGLSADNDLRRLGPRLVQLQSGRGTEWRDALAGADLDVLFVIGDERSLHTLIAGLGARMADLAVSARFGCWGFRFSNGASESWAGLGEVISGVSVTTSRLVAYLPDGSERLLVQSWTRTLPFSVGANRNRLLARTAAYPARALRDLNHGGADWLQARPAEASAKASAGRGAAGAALPAILQVSRRMAKRGLEKLAYVDQWFLAYRFGNEAAAKDDWGPFTCLLPPRDRFWADPFPLRWGERHLVFFEELPFARRKAHISVIEVAADGSHSEPMRALSSDYHLSYPFLFEAEGQLFMIPETGRNRSVELYRCLRIPDVWKLEKVLLRDAHYVDATLHQVGGRWWMFVNVGQDLSNLHDELHLYYADHFLGPWNPHRANPVKSDVRSARCAGRLFEEGGQLMRPSQICVPRYGAGLVLNQVLELNPERYREREVARIQPPRDSRILGMHTLNRAGALTVVDGFLPRRRWVSDPLASFTPERLALSLSEAHEG